MRQSLQLLDIVLPAPVPYYIPMPTMLKRSWTRTGTGQRTRRQTTGIGLTGVVGGVVSTYRPLAACACVCCSVSTHSSLVHDASP